MRVAMIGQKGIPALYGGVERHVEEIAVRLAAMGIETSVYCRRYFTPERGSYRGVHRIHVPSVSTKHLDAGTHGLFCTLDAIGRGFDVVHYHGIGPALFSPLARLGGKKVVVTYHAQDWRQVKWGRLPRWFLKSGEANGVRYSHRLITVSKILKSYVRELYGVEAAHVPNGATPGEKVAPKLIEETFGLERDGYVLSVGRMIAERSFHDLIQVFERLETSMRLVLVGEASFEEEYYRSLRRLAGERVLFTGSLTGEILTELYANAALYVNPSSLEGLPISVLEAMALATPVLVSDIPENLEAVGEDGFRFRVGQQGDLARALEEILPDASRRAEMGLRGRRRIEEGFCWDDIAARVREIYEQVVRP